MSEVVAPPNLISEIEAMKARIYDLEQSAPKKQEEFKFEVVASEGSTISGSNNALNSMYTTAWRPYDDCIMVGMRVTVNLPSGFNLNFRVMQDGNEVASVMLLPGEQTIEKKWDTPIGFTPATPLKYDVQGSADGWGELTIQGSFTTYAKQYLSGGLNFHVDVGQINV